MAFSEDLGTDIDIVIAMWFTTRKINPDISWEDRCALREAIYQLFMAENRRANGGVEPNGVCGQQAQPPADNRAMVPYDCDKCVNASKCGAYRRGMRVLNCDFVQHQ